MSRQQDHRHGMMQFEDFLCAFRGLHEALSGGDAPGMTPQQASDFWFLMREMVQRLEDIFDVIVQERLAQKQEDRAG